MCNRTNSSRISLTIAVGLLAMTLAGPALAADRGDAGRGAKAIAAMELPAQPTLPISFRYEAVESGRSLLSPDKWMVGPWRHTVQGLLWTLRGISF